MFKGDNTMATQKSPLRPYAKFGTRLRELRKKAGLTVRDCYKYFGVRQQTWNNWELGNSPVSRGLLLAICQLFNVPPAYFADVWETPYDDEELPIAENVKNQEVALSLANLTPDQQEVLRNIAKDLRTGKVNGFYARVQEFVSQTNAAQQKLAETQLDLIEGLRK